LINKQATLKSGRQNDFKTTFSIDAQADFSLSFLNKASFLQNTTYDFTLIGNKAQPVTSPSSPGSPLVRKIKLTIFVRGVFGEKTKTVIVKEGIRFEVLWNKFTEYATQNGLDMFFVRYMDGNDVITIDSQESLDTCIEVLQGNYLKIIIDNDQQPEPYQLMTPVTPTYELPFNTNSHVKRWKKGNAIGGGAHAKVYLGMNLDTLELIAIKELTINSNTTMEELSHEVEIMSQFKHEHIVKYLGSEKREHKLYIFLEYIPGGTVENILAVFRPEENIVKKFTKQILLGLKYLHDHGIVHTDLKTANLLVDERSNIYLSDFGCSKRVDEKTNMITGTPNYVAPEVIREQCYTTAADIWSLGCCVLEMLTHVPPWYHVLNKFQDPIQLMYYIMESEECPPIPEHLSDKARHFLSLCLKRERKERATVDELLLHEFIVGDVINVTNIVHVATDDDQDGFTFNHIPSEEFSSEDDVSPVPDSITEFLHRNAEEQKHRSFDRFPTLF
jgi:hypothetical protein